MDKEIEELKKRIEDLEKRSQQIQYVPYPTQQPHFPSYLPQQINWTYCNLCMRYNCGQIHITC